MRTGWVWYQLPPVSDGTVVVGISLGFNLGRLEMIQLTDTDKTYGANWRQSSEEGERSRAESISRWLNAKGFPPGAYRWGAISAGFDPKGGFGSATVRFCSLTSYRSVPGTSVTDYSGDMGNSLAPKGFSAHSTFPHSWSKKPNS
jgi:hypothetical protein